MYRPESTFGGESNPFIDLTNKVYWYDPNKHLSTSSGDFVSWGDRFGISPTLTPLTNAPRVGDVVYNGVPTVNFNGANIERISASSVFSSLTNAVTIYTVAKATSTRGMLLHVSNAGQGNKYAIVLNNDTTLFASCEMNGDGILGSEIWNTGLSVSTFQVITYILSGSSGSLYINNSLSATHTYPTNSRIPFSLGITIGGFRDFTGDYLLTGDVGDQLCFLEAHDSTNRTLVNEYLIDKYAL